LKGKPADLGLPGKQLFKMEEEQEKSVTDLRQAGRHSQGHRPAGNHPNLPDSLSRSRLLCSSQDRYPANHLDTDVTPASAEAHLHYRAVQRHSAI